MTRCSGRRGVLPNPFRRRVLVSAAGLALGPVVVEHARAQRAKAVGFRQLELRYEAAGGARSRRLLLWYPAEGEERRFDHGGHLGRVVPDAPVAAGRHPLIVFSHGYLGAADQSVFITETLARNGYLVAAVDHADAQGRAGIGGIVAFARPRDWIDETYLDRRDDLSALIDQMTAAHNDAGSFLHGRVELSAVGAMGHSLGGYTALGLAGARRSWHDRRVRAVLGLSPYVAPYLLGDAGVTVDLPAMLQGGTLDIGLTADLPAFHARLRGARYLLVLRGENHLGWTNWAAQGLEPAQAIQQGNPRWIVDYATAFFDRHLRGLDRARLLERPNAALESYLYVPAPRR